MGVEFRIDTRAFAQLQRDLKEFDPALFRSFRKRLRVIGNKGADEVRRTVRLPPRGDRPGTRGSRERVAKNTKVGISQSSTGAGVKITTRGAPTQGFAAAYNTEWFRHPVFADPSLPRQTRDGAPSWKWVDQRGRPFFGIAITKVLRARLQREMSDAADDAFRAMKATKI